MKLVHAGMQGSEVSNKNACADSYLPYSYTVTSGWIANRHIINALAHHIYVKFWLFTSDATRIRSAVD